MKNRLRNFVMVISIAAWISACSKSVDLGLEPEVTAYISSDKDNPISLSLEDIAYVELNDWLKENRSDWYTTSGRYPGGVYILSGEYGIQVTRTQVVIYSASRTDTRALYTQNLSGDELKSVKDLAN